MLVPHNELCNFILSTYFISHDLLQWVHQNQLTTHIVYNFLYVGLDFNTPTTQALTNLCGTRIKLHVDPL